MLSTPHLLVGAAIARVIPEPAISLPLAFASHLLLDATPHWDGSPSAPFSKKVVGGVILDYAVGISIILALTMNQPDQFIVLLGAFMATLPDFIMAFSRHVKTPILDFPPLKWFNKVHSHVQNTVKISHGFVTGVATSLAAIIFLIR